MHPNHLLSMAPHLIASRMISWLNTWPRALLSLLTLFFFLNISMFCRFLFLFAPSLSRFLERRFYLNQTKIFNFGQILRNAQRKMHRISTKDKSQYENRCFNSFFFIWKKDRFLAKIMYSIVSLYHHRKHLSFLDVFFKVKLDNICKCSKTFEEKVFCLPIKARAVNIRKSRFSYKRIPICLSNNDLYNKWPKLDGISEIFDGKITNVSIDHLTASGCDYGFDYYPIEQWG